ncbi:MAG: hypothetical protein WC617_05105 [Rhodanobacter sp.]
MDGLIGSHSEGMRGNDLGGHDGGFVVAAAPVVATARTLVRRANPGQPRPNPHPLPAPGGVAAARAAGIFATAATRSGYGDKTRHARHRLNVESELSSGAAVRQPRGPVRHSRGLQASDRVYLMAPARWKSVAAVERSRPLDWSSLVSVPALWRASRRSATPLHASSKSWSEVFKAWRGSVPWHRWHAVAASAWRLLETRRVLLARSLSRAQVFRALSWQRVTSRGVFAGFASIVATGALLGWGLTHSPARSLPAGMLTTPAPAAVQPAMTAVTMPTKQETIAPAVAMAPASPATAAEPSATAETGGALLADVSTMDLMMPIAEPDLDITSRHSLWAQVGKASGIDPLLLYSVALVESKALYPGGKVAPTPWLFRVNDHLVRGDRHHVQLEMAAASQFGSAVQDVGIMQVYYPMHRDAVRDPLTLLNPRTNITVAAKILRAGMRQTHDRVLGVGYYHSHTPTLARDYGTAVLTVYQRLKGVYRQRGGRELVAR